MFIFGCGKKPVVAEANSNSARAIPASAPTQAPSPQSPYSRPTSAPAPASVVVPENATAALGVLTQAVRKFSAENQRVPKTLEEVLRAGYIRNLPPAPAGKKFILNSKRLEVLLADR